MLKAQGLLRPGLIVIHGSAFRDGEFREMAANGVGLVWSPRSNYELYGETTIGTTDPRAGWRTPTAFGACA